MPRIIRIMTCCQIDLVVKVFMLTIRCRYSTVIHRRCELCLYIGITWQKTSRCATNVLLKESKWYVQHNYLLLCVAESNRLHVSTLHAGHLQAFTKMISKWLSKHKGSGGPRYTTSRRKRPPEAHTDTSSPHKDYTRRKATHILCKKKNQRWQSPLAVHRNANLMKTRHQL